MLIELERSAADPSDLAAGDDIRALADLCRFVASECGRLKLDDAERGALNLAAELMSCLVRHCH